jgi:hypothetical protein
MAYFPPNARNGQTHKKFGRRFAYSEATESWTPVSTLASVAEVRATEQAAEANNTTVYVTAVELPLSGNTAGAMAFVQETNRLYLWSGTGWYNVATVASAGASISGASSSYTLSTDGTPTVVTLTQSGLTSPTWSYEVTSGSLGRTATVTQADNVFTITPSTLAKNVGSFGLTFKATDGSNTIVTSSQFTMSNTAPVIGTGPSAAYTLASDGTPTVITLAATDADGHAITWSYEVIGGSLGGTDVSINGSEFTITPSVDNNDAGTFQLRFVASDGASFDAEISEFTLEFPPPWSQQAELLASDRANLDKLGYSVAIDGDIAIVGAYLDDNTVTDGGAAYIFTRTGTTWTEEAKIVASDRANNDYFGYSVAISGDTVIVGAWRDDNSRGAAYIFTRSGTTWTQQAKIRSSDSLGVSSFGNSVAIDGDTAIVGSYGTLNEAGAAYIFTRTGTTWTQQVKILASDYTTGAKFGWSVSISVDTAIVGAYSDDNTVTDGGAAYIFTRSGTTWAEEAKIVASDFKMFDEFGRSVAISGDTVIVGAWRERTVARASGAAYIFTRSGTTWTEQAKLIASDAELDDYFGSSVALEGDTAVVGAYWEGIYKDGAAYIFTRSGTTWTEQMKIQKPNPFVDQFGTSVSISNSTIVAGAPDRNGGGAAYIFQAA